MVTTTPENVLLMAEEHAVSLKLPAFWTCSRTSGSHRPRHSSAFAGSQQMKRSTITSLQPSTSKRQCVSHQPTADRRQVRDVKRPPHKYFRPQQTRASVTPASFPPTGGLQTLDSDGRDAGPPRRPPTLPALRAAFPRATPRGHPHSVSGLQD